VLAGRDLMAGAQTGPERRGVCAADPAAPCASGEQLGIAGAPPGARVGSHAHARACHPGCPELCRIRQTSRCAARCLRGCRHERADRAAAQRGRGAGGDAGRLSITCRTRPSMLNQVSVLVLDEGDRMLDMDSCRIKRIIALLPAQRQNLLFSATFPDEIRTLAKTLLRNPAELQIAARMRRPSSSLTCWHPVRGQRDLLSPTASDPRTASGLVFSPAPASCESPGPPVAARPYPCRTPSRDKSQPAARRAGGFQVGARPMCCGDRRCIARLGHRRPAAGDQFRQCRIAGDYIHRIGRTGRRLTGRLFHWLHPRISSRSRPSRADQEALERCWFPDPAQRRHRRHADGRQRRGRPRRDAKNTAESRTVRAVDRSSPNLTSGPVSTSPAPARSPSQPKASASSPGRGAAGWTQARMSSIRIGRRRPRCKHRSQRRIVGAR